MKRRTLAAPALALMVLATLVGALVQVPTVAAQEDPASVLRRFIDARNRGDVAGTLALATDDIRFVGGPQCTPVAPCIGRDALRAEVQSYIGAGVQATIVGTPQVSGATVRARVEASAQPYRAAGVDRIVNTVTAEVRGGQVASFTGVPDASDPQTARWLALQGVPPMRLPATGGSGVHVGLGAVAAGALAIACGLRAAATRGQLHRR